MAKPINDKLFKTGQVSLYVNIDGEIKVAFITRQRGERRYLVEDLDGNQRTVYLGHFNSKEEVTEGYGYAFSHKGEAIAEIHKQTVYLFRRRKDGAPARRRFNKVIWPHEIEGVTKPGTGPKPPPVIPPEPEDPNANELYITLNLSEDWDMWGDYIWPIEVTDDWELYDDWELWSDTGEIYDVMEFTNDFELNV